MPEKASFGHYEITTRGDGSPVELGRGAMGITYRAWDTSLECPVALKVINTEQLRSPAAGQRLVREARAAARLRHRHVASVFHLGIEKDVYFYAMELLDGETIEACVHRDGPFDTAETLRVATQVARALNAAQEHHLVHRDIKPANLMLVREDDETIVKVIDFGLAKAGAAATPDSTDSVHGFVGTPHFASPEQMQERELDGRSDIYSLGVSMWFMLTGRVPFGGPLAQVMSQQLNMEPPFATLRHVPPQVVALLRKMLSKNPDERPPSAAALRKVLEQISLDIAGSDLATSVARAPGKEARPEKYSSAYRTGVVLQGRYRIVGELADEMLGRAFQVEDAELFRAARLIILHRYLVEDTAVYAQLQDEVAQAVPLEHPNLLRVYGLELAERSAPAHLLLMEWTNGFSLLDLLRNRRKLDTCEALPLIKHVAIGLDYALRTGLKLVSLSLGETLVHFPDTETVPSETMLLRRPVGEWPAFHVRLQPLAGVRGAMPDETWGGDRTVVGGVLSGPPAAENIHHRYLRDLTALTYELLGGTGTVGDRRGPLAAVSEEGNAVLRRGLDHPESFTTARSFYDALLKTEGAREALPPGTAGEDVRFQCSNCGQWLVIDAEARGADLECPTCAKILTVPLATPRAPTRKEPRLKPKILIVEDNELSRDMLSRRLQRRQYEVVLAIDGVEGLQMAQLEHPDLILMDMNLPLISGWQVTRQLKSMPGMRDLPIIALTAYAMLDDEEKAREAGCDDFEPKPLELSRLLQKIEAQLQKTKPA
ncbi:MAG: protein kinase [Chthoniobacter sp.]|nr:protein kinase [Chthoniobacter sp.]